MSEMPTPRRPEAPALTNEGAALGRADQGEGLAAPTRFTVHVDDLALAPRLPEFPVAEGGLRPLGATVPFAPPEAGLRPAGLTGAAMDIGTLAAPDPAPPQRPANVPFVPGKRVAPFDHKER